MWGSIPPQVHSGYGVQTALVTPRIKSLGHDIAVGSNSVHQAWIQNFPSEHGDVPVYPGLRGDTNGGMLLPSHAQHFQADVVMTHYDAYIFAGHMFEQPWVPWFPIDTEELAPAVEASVTTAKMRITQTRHGQAACEARGLDCEYVPAGFDKNTYRPVDGSLWREMVGVSPSTYLVGIVAANSGGHGRPSRKSLIELFQGFKMFHEEHPDSMLYAHTFAQDYIDLFQVMKDIEMPEGVVWFPNPYLMVCGLCTPEYMAEVYSGIDVLLNPSMGEGFGVPILEAQACGTPVITGDWTSMSEITRTGLALPKDAAEPFTVMMDNKRDVYGQQYIVRPESVRDALLNSVKWRVDPAQVAEAVSEYEINNVWSENWLPVIEKIEELANVSV